MIGKIFLSLFFAEHMYGGGDKAKYRSGAEMGEKERMIGVPPFLGEKRF